MGWFDLDAVVWLGVAVATLAAFIVGVAWYHPRGLGTAWSRVSSIDVAELGESRAVRGAVSAAVLAVTAVFLNVLMAELLVVGYGARQHIRRNQLHQLHQENTITRKHGSFTLEECLAGLVRRGVVERGEAAVRANHPEDFAHALDGAG